jgi:hypothetical protein
MDDRSAKGVGLGRGTKDEKTQMTIRKKREEKNGNRKTLNRNMKNSLFKSSTIFDVRFYDFLTTSNIEH